MIEVQVISHFLANVNINNNLQCFRRINETECDENPKAQKLSIFHFAEWCSSCFPLTKNIYLFILFHLRRCAVKHKRAIKTFKM